MTPPSTRSAEIADAVLRLVARDGIEAVSMRKVAAEAQKSLGSVQRAYGDKDSLLRAALVRSIEHADRRIEERLAASATIPGLADLLRTAAREVLPLSDETLAAERVWLAFVAHAAVTPGFGAPVAERYERSRGAVAALLAYGRPDVSDADRYVESTVFVGLVDGLAAQLLAGVIAEAAALEAVEALISRLVPNEPGPPVS